MLFYLVIAVGLGEHSGHDETRTRKVGDAGQLALPVPALQSHSEEENSPVRQQTVP